MKMKKLFCLQRFIRSNNARLCLYPVMKGESGAIERCSTPCCDVSVALISLLNWNGPLLLITLDVRMVGPLLTIPPSLFFAHESLAGRKKGQWREREQRELHYKQTEKEKTGWCKRGSAAKEWRGVFENKIRSGIRVYKGWCGLGISCFKTYEPTGKVSAPCRYYTDSVTAFNS